MAYEESIRAALRGGINLLDTAVNYRFQRMSAPSEKLSPRWSRPASCGARKSAVATKGGYITFDGEVPPNPREWYFGVMQCEPSTISRAATIPVRMKCSSNHSRGLGGTSPSKVI